MADTLVIIGAGIGGVSAAYYLAVRHGVRNVTLIDERDPLTLTSDKGTQGYRNWWPGPDDTMLRFIARSIDLMEEAAAKPTTCSVSIVAGISSEPALKPGCMT